MNCPRCNGQMVIEDYMGIEVDKCRSCKGMWLDLIELDELEDKAYAEDALKGQVIYRTAPSTLKCPKCGKVMKKFNYKLYDVELDYCEEHGYWLDKGEEERVLQIMKQRAKDMQRKADEEGKWTSFLGALRFGGKKRGR
jgi:Zn-finger nucleic acid-binding protein